MKQSSYELNKKAQENKKVQDTDIINAFAQTQSKNEIAEVLKELFDNQKINMIGDLSHDEIKLATRIYMIAEMKDMQLWKQGLYFYFELLLSKNRKSRRELIDAIRGYQPMTFGQRLGNFFNRGGGHQ